jgi:plasmid maintenance system antidote protein VapI
MARRACPLRLFAPSRETSARIRAIGNEIILGKRSITPAMSIRFGAFFGQTQEFWHRLQVECDFCALAKQSRKLTARIVPARELKSA